MLLAIDTSSEIHCLALFQPPSFVKITSWRRGETSKELLPKIKQFLRENKVKLNELKAVAVFRGPGSFTGLRVGISVAQALGFALDIPVYGFKDKNLVKGAKRGYLKLKRGEKTKPIKPVYNWPQQKMRSLNSALVFNREKENRSSPGKRK